MGIVGTDEQTCSVARTASLPCFVDGLVQQKHRGEADKHLPELGSTVKGKLAKSANMFGAQVQLKWWYTRALLHGRYHLVFSDADVSWLRDPLRHWERSFDVQGLSDIYSSNLTLQPYHE